MPEDKSQNGSIYGSIFDSDALSRETREILELGLAALAFGTPAASEAGSMYGSMRGGSLFGSTRGYAAAQEAQEAAAPGGYSSYAAYTAAQRPSPAVQRAAGDSGRRKSEPGDFGHWLNESAISTATEKTPVPVSPAFPGDQRLAHVAEKTEEQMRRAVQADVAESIKDITWVSGRQAQAADHRQQQLPQEADITPEEAAEREAIRREIQEKMAVLRRQNQASQSQAKPVSPRGAVASPVLMQQQSPMAAPKSDSSATSIRDGDVFWKDLLNDLKLVGNDLDAINRDVELPDLDEPYRSKSDSLRLPQRNYAHDSMTGSYLSSFVSSRSSSPSALDNPVRAAAKREILLGASLSSDYGLSNDGEYCASESRGQKFHRHPDLGPNWQKDLDLLGSQALEALNRASNQSYTDSLIRQMQGGSGAAVPQHVDLPAAAYQAPRPGMYSHATGATQSRMEAPRDLRVRCTVGDGGATAHATWQAVWETWRPVVNVAQVTFEVQMIVRWLPGQAWNTMFTVKEPYCTVTGLKAKNPFAVRVRAIAKNWSSDYTRPVEFVTEQSQSSDQVAAEVAAHVSQATRAAQRAASSNAHSEPLHRSSYLERVLQSPRADSQLHHTQQPSQIQHPQHQAPVDMRALSPLRTLAPMGREPGRPMHTFSSALASHAPQTQRITLDDPENPHYGWALRNATATPAAPQQVDGMAPVRTAETSNAPIHQVLPRVDDSKAQTYSSQRIPPESKSQAAGAPMPIVWPAVRRITLDDPENPHYGWTSRNPTATPDSNSLLAPPPVSSAGLQVTHAGAPDIYGSIYQAQRSATMDPAQRSFHNAHLTYATSSEDLGPLARALGVTQYQDASALGESKLLRAVAQPVSSTGINLPVARAVRVSTTPNDGAVQANK